MTFVFEFLFDLFNRCILFLQDCSFVVYGYSVNLLGIFLGLIIFGIALSSYFHGGSY